MPSELTTAAQLSLLDQAIQKLYRYVDASIDGVRPFRAVVIGQADGMVQIRRLVASTGETALRARCVGFDLVTDDEVLCLPMADGIPVVVGKLQRAAPSGLSLTPNLTLYGDLVADDVIVKTLNSPFSEEPIVSNSAVGASTTSTSVYSINVQNTSFDLPTGTWTVHAWGGGLFAHSDDNGAVRVHLQVGNDAGTALVAACRQDPGRSYVGIGNAATNQSGSIEIRLEYRPNASGTAYAGGGWLMAIAYRTS